jgi:hypothetical protein
MHFFRDSGVSSVLSLKKLLFLDETPNTSSTAPTMGILYYIEKKP